MAYIAFHKLIPELPLPNFHPAHRTGDCTPAPQLVFQLHVLVPGFGALFNSPKGENTFEVRYITAS